jgi:hypothetical protein
VVSPSLCNGRMTHAQEQPSSLILMSPLMTFHVLNYDALY